MASVADEAMNGDGDPAPAAAPAAAPAPLTAEQIEDFNCRQLVFHLRARGMRVSGAKAILQARLTQRVIAENQAADVGDDVDGDVQMDNAAVPQPSVDHSPAVAVARNDAVNVVPAAVAAAPVASAVVPPSAPVIVQDQLNGAGRGVRFSVSDDVKDGGQPNIPPQMTPAMRQFAMDMAQQMAQQMARQMTQQVIGAQQSIVNSQSAAGQQFPLAYNFQNPLAPSVINDESNEPFTAFLASCSQSATPAAQMLGLAENYGLPTQLKRVKSDLQKGMCIRLSQSPTISYLLPI